MALLPLFFDGLTPELQKRAEEEFGETPAVKERALREFRTLIIEQDDINRRQDDLFLLRFLRTNKYDVQKAFKLLCNYNAMREKHWGTFTGRNPSDLRHVFDMNGIGFAAGRTSAGSHVGICIIGRCNLEKASIEDFLATMLIMGEFSLECEASQITGGTYIVDMKEYSARHYSEVFAIPFLSLCIDLFQNCWPERMKNIHFVNETHMFRAVFRIVRPRLKEKLRCRILFHGSDLNSLHVFVPKALLPVELGGRRSFDNKVFTDYLRVCD